MMCIEIKQKSVKLFASVIFKDKEFLELAEQKLQESYGELESVDWCGSFDSTDYYYSEFGRPLQRKLICFKKEIDLEDICDVKLATNSIEDETRRDKKRRVNIDPGYITEAKMVLLTTKNYAHRIYLGKGIFAEGTLLYKDGGFSSWPWTYPDYASPKLIAYFNNIRKIYRKD